MFNLCLTHVQHVNWNKYWTYVAVLPWTNKFQHEIMVIITNSFNEFHLINISNICKLKKNQQILIIEIKNECMCFLC